MIERALAASRRPADFQVVHHSVQSNHLHLLIEARCARALSRGMQGLLVRAARALNRLWRRQGKLFADRFHAHALHTPREVRHALVYVLNNARKHGIVLRGPDPYSSGRSFDGWRNLPPQPTSRAIRAPGAFTPPVAASWLLRKGWARWGPIEIDELPAIASGTRKTATARV